MDTEYMFGRNFLVRPVTDSLYTWQDDKQNGYQKNMNKIERQMFIYRRCPMD